VDAPGRHRALAELRHSDARNRQGGKPFDLGLGWFRPAKERDASPAFVQHRGDGGAFANDMRIYPGPSLRVVMMGNATSYDRDLIARAVVETFGTRPSVPAKG